MDIAAKNTFLARSLCVSDMTGGDLGLACAVQDDIAEGGISIWTHFGGNLVSPKWMIEDERDIWVVKCAASLRRKNNFGSGWVTRLGTKTLPDKNSPHPQRCHPRRNEVESGDLVGLCGGGWRPGSASFLSGRLWCRPCLPQRPT